MHLALDGAGNPSISYIDSTNTSLKFAYFNGTSWVTETVDNSGDVGSYSALALDSSGNPSISYYDTTNGDLLYATVPEPGVISLLTVCGLGCLLFFRRRSAFRA